MQNEGQGPLKAVTTLQHGDSSESIYDQWAHDYETDLIDTYGYVSPAAAADALADLLPEHSAEIIDYGCGTGLVGTELASRGYTRIDGADLSTGMLDQARAKGVYRELFVADLTAPIDVADERYDALLCVGVMGAGHLVPEHFPELVRTVKRGAPIVLIGNGTTYHNEGYTERFEAIARSGLIEILSETELHYMVKIERPGVLLTARRS